MAKPKEGVFNFNFDLYDENVTAFISERGYDFWKFVSEDVKEQLRKVLTSAVEGGISIDELTETLQREIFDPLTESEGYKARLIARTETTISLNAGASLAAEQTGLDLRKGWLTSEDDAVRDSHADAEAEGFINTDEAFGNGLMFPGDPSGDVSELANCRCSLIYEEAGGGERE